MMKLKVNGEMRELADHATVSQLLEQLGLAGTPTAVEVNREVVPKRRHDETTLNDGDVVEVVTLVGGG
jgi:thiamine biosynthesis protein ThiS